MATTGGLLSEVHLRGTYQVITAVGLNAAHASDQNATVPMVETLIPDGNKPDELLADTGYGSCENIVGCAELGVVLVAPVQDPDAPKRPERWIGEGTTEPPAEQAASAPGIPEQATPAPAASPPTRVMTLGEFTFPETFREVLTCPHGVSPTEQHSTDAAQYATFPGASCPSCPLAETCITRRIAHSEDRTPRWRDRRAATATRRRAQQTPAFKEGYRLRSGIESPMRS